MNTPDNRLEIFRATDTGLQHCAAVPVGLEPVAVAIRTETEVWVVNHLSDSVSVVQIDPNTCETPMGRVVRTLLVGDEPRDIVFAGPEGNRAFITAAHRGQHLPFDPQLTTPGIGRADVWVFDANTLGTDLGGTPLTILTLFTDTPRALAVTPDGTRVYAAGFHTGNQTTTVFEEVVSANGGLPEPRRNIDGEWQPETGLIVKFDGANWVDERRRQWNNHVKFSLPDQDLFVIDAMATPPVQVPGADGVFAQVSTVLFNMIVNPVNGHVYVANTEARNEVRFEGFGVVADTTVIGHLHESRITVLRGHEAVPRHLNKHINYNDCCAALPNDKNARSLAFPMDMAISSNGATLYVAALGSSKIGVFDTAELENDTFTPDMAHHIRVSGGGPSGVALDETRQRLYVLTRFDNAISIIDTAQRAEVGHVAMYNPEPESIVRGRPFLYDAAFTSSHGDSACASCHVFADFDSLAWDLGDPDGSTIPNPRPFILSPQDVFSPISPHFRPMKGPMTTQSLRGLANHGPMHWRGDRLGGNDAASAQPDSGTFDEDAAFKKFNPAFVGLLGRQSELTDEEMQAFTDFVLQITYPPNPIRRLDNSLTPDQQRGRDIYFSAGASDTFFNCNGCQVLDPSGNAEFSGVAQPGFFGTDGRYTFDAEPQVFKVPHLRNMYQKIGMFGMPRARLFLPESIGSDNVFMGDEVRGFGFFHDGSVDTIFRFLRGVAFVRRAPGGLDPGNPDGFPVTPEGDVQRRQVEQFLLAFDSNLAPIVGQQTTLAAANAAVAGPRVDLLRARAEARECDLVAKQQDRGYLYQNNGQFVPDRRDAPALRDAALRALAASAAGEITYTCVPLGSGIRMALDRDEDGFPDGDERLAGSDPANPLSTP